MACITGLSGLLGRFHPLGDTCSWSIFLFELFFVFELALRSNRRYAFRLASRLPMLHIMVRLGDLCRPRLSRPDHPADTTEHDGRGHDELNSSLKQDSGGRLAYCTEFACRRRCRRTSTFSTIPFLLARHRDHLVSCSFVSSQVLADHSGGGDTKSRRARKERLGNGGNAGNRQPLSRHNVAALLSFSDRLAILPCSRDSNLRPCRMPTVPT